MAHLIRSQHLNVVLSHYILILSLLKSLVTVNKTEPGIFTFQTSPPNHRSHHNNDYHFFLLSCYPLHLFNGCCSHGNPWDVITSSEEVDWWKITSSRCSGPGTEPSPWPKIIDSIINHIKAKIPGNLMKWLFDLLRWPEPGGSPHRSFSLVENIE